MTPNLVLQTLDFVWQELRQRKLPVMLVGGLALPIWNYPRSTQDIDLLLLASGSDELLLLCQELGCRPTRQPPIAQLEGLQVLQTEFCPADQHVDIGIDFLVGHTEFHAAALARAIPVNYSGVHSTVQVATCEDLILLKLQSGRLVDLADCQRLLELNQEVDRAYLLHWAEQLQVQGALTRVCS